ncbi:MAG: proteasome subunit beta, partial [Candidatus Methanomethylophilaceae archaeon]|nr:proteasome subunit beta [Candidatus Methanomethylophilaceae archaeon]
DLTRDEGIDVAITALNSARKRDNCTGDGMLVAFIGPDGYEDISKEEIRNRCSALGFQYPN